MWFLYIEGKYNNIKYKYFEKILQVVLLYQLFTTKAFFWLDRSNFSNWLYLIQLQVPVKSFVWTLTLFSMPWYSTHHWGNSRTKLILWSTCTGNFNLDSLHSSSKTCKSLKLLVIKGKNSQTLIPTVSKSSVLKIFLS